MTLLGDLARFNVSNCNVVANNRVYLLSYSMELFVVLQQCRLRMQSNAGNQRAPPLTGSPVRPSVRVPTPDRPPVSRRRAGDGVVEERQRGLERDAHAAHASARPSASHTHPTTLVAYCAVRPSDRRRWPSIGPVWA